VNLFIKGFIVGIAKIIPGVSGAMIAVSFSIYDKLINAITCFFDDWKSNLKFLLIFGGGVFLSIVCFSNIVRYLIDNYYFITMMLFIGLIVGGTYNFSRDIIYNFKNVITILFVIFIVMFISLFNIGNNYIIQGNYMDYIMFFVGGVIEVFASIVPGISGTALLMLIGIYDNVLMLFSNIFDLSFVINNIVLYISYGIGIIISFIVCSLGISYLLKKYRMLFDTIVYGLCISSILLLVLLTFKNSFVFIYPTIFYSEIFFTFFYIKFIIYNKIFSKEIFINIFKIFMIRI
jgi:putative membrane protein